MKGCSSKNRDERYMCPLCRQRRQERKHGKNSNEQQQRRKLSWKQKEKRKREQGQAKGGKGNYVEEEKRVAREFGVYSGFDT